jgi:predicted RNase H-like nuclease
MLPDRMVWVAGADGCKRGWLRAARETSSGELRFDVFGEASEMLRAAPSPRVLGLDIPIGLPNAGRRACDEAARGVLKPFRTSSVFPAPIRPALHAKTRLEASAITEACDGRLVGTQAFALYGKIREVDALLAKSGEARARIREVHPEVCFWAWNGGEPMRAAKKTPAGLRQRRALAESWLGAGVLSRARAGHPRGEVADDDILDAIAALWTATRIAAGRARTLPATPPVDATGLRMEIVY